MKKRCRPFFMFHVCMFHRKNPHPNPLPEYRERGLQRERRRMPKVLFVVPHLSNSVRLLADYLRYLDRAFEVTLYALEEDRRFEHEFPTNCRKLFQPKTGRKMALPSQLWNIWRAARGQDLIVSWMELTPTYLCYAVGKLRRKPVIGWVHANLSRVFELGQRPRKLHLPVMRRVYPR